MVHGAEGEGHAHEARELLEALRDLPHDALRGRGPRRGGGHHGGDGQVRRVVRRPRGQRLQQRRPLRAEGVAQVQDVQPRRLLLLRGRRRGGRGRRRCPSRRRLEERLEYGPVGGHVTEGRPWAQLLEPERGASRGLERRVPVGRGGERAQRARAGGGEAREEALEEVGRQLLVHVAVRRRQLVEHPHELLHALAVAGGHGAGALQQQLRGPPPGGAAAARGRRGGGGGARAGGRRGGAEVEVDIHLREREVCRLEQVAATTGGGAGRRGRGLLVRWRGRGRRRGRRLRGRGPARLEVAGRGRGGEVFIHVKAVVVAAFFLVRRRRRLVVVVVVVVVVAAAGASSSSSTAAAAAATAGGVVVVVAGGLAAAVVGVGVGVGVGVVVVGVVGGRGGA